METKRGMGLGHFLVLGLALATVASLLSGIVFYEVQLEGSKSRLSSALNTQIRIVDSVVDSHLVDGEASEEEAIERIVAAYRANQGFGETSEFVLGRLVGDKIVFLIEQRFSDSGIPLPIPIDEARESNAEPMRLALRGKSGTVVALDYRGVPVVAAYAPTLTIGLGVVAKMDLAEVRNPFIKAFFCIEIALVLLVLVVFRMVNGYTNRLNLKLKAAEAESSIHLNRMEDLRFALDIHGIVSITDSSGKIKYANQHFCDLSGYSETELKGETHNVVSSGYHERAFYDEIWSTIRLGEAWQGEIQNRSKAGRLYWVDTTIVPFRDGSGQVDQFIAIQRDVTALKENESALIAAREQAEAANIAKSNFLANMSHEIRTPMNAIIGYSDLLCLSELDESQSHDLSAIRHAGSMLLNLLNDILDLSKIEAGKWDLNIDSLFLRPVVEGVIDLLANSAEKKGISLSFECRADSMVRVFSDKDALHRILVNLVGNAIKFTDEGSVLVLIEDVGIEGEEREVCISILDTGHGISQDEIVLIFEKFNQGKTAMKKSSGGTGLGLPISQALARKLGGGIEVSSELGVGSRFAFSLPRLAKGSREPSFSGVKSEYCSLLGGIEGKALVVEDNLVNQDMLKKMLQSFGLKCDLVESGTQAVESVQRETYDIVMMDWQMPGMNGLEAVKRIRQYEKKNGDSPLPVIAVTARAMIGDREECIEAGMTDYISKPVNLITLGEILKRILGVKAQSER